MTKSYLVERYKGEGITYSKYEFLSLLVISIRVNLIYLRDYASIRVFFDIFERIRKISGAFALLRVYSLVLVFSSFSGFFEYFRKFSRIFVYLLNN